MALFRRGKQQDPQPAPAPVRPPQERTGSAEDWTPVSLTAAAPPEELSPADWLPPDATTEKRERGSSSPGEWIPAGVEAAQPNRRRSSPAHATPDARAAQDAQAPPTARPDPELSDRLDILERQIADAEREAAAAESRGEPQSAEAAESYARLHRAVADLRARLERESGTQRETIESLEARLANFEEHLRRPPGYVPPAARAATALRILVLIGVFIVIAGAPLFTTLRTTCPNRGGERVSWKFVKPFDDSGPRRCQNELGGTVVLDAIGLK